MTAKTLSLLVPPESSGRRLDRFLAERIGGTTRSALRRLIDDGRVAVDGRAATKPGLGLKTGMTIRVVLPPPPSEMPLPQSIPLDVLYEDDDLLALAKPAGLIVHPGHGHREGTLINALLGRGTRLASVGAPDRPGIVHRLDRDTSGLLVVAKSDRAHRRLARAWAERRVAKRYVALVWGHPDPPAGRIERPIGRSRSTPLKMATRGTRGRTRPALTLYRTVETLPGIARLDLDLRTGRTHQIRVHLQSIHHPVVGDERYGGRQWRGVLDPLRRKALRELDRLALHAAELVFDHPVSGRPLHLRAELPADLERLLEVLRRAS